MNQLNYILSMSHEADKLFQQLQLNLSNPEGMFRKLVVVPSRLVNNYLYKKLLKYKVVTGFKIFELPVAVDYLVRLVGFQDKKNHNLPATSLLSMHLEALISEIMEQKEELSNGVFQPLFNYLSDTHPHKIRTKIQELSDTISLEFLQYGLYGGKALKEWFKQSSWQRVLWDRLFATWDYPYKLFELGSVLNPLQLQMEIHLVGFTYIPQVYEGFFQRLPDSFKFYEYYLNPCADFWGDICSEKERLFLNRRYKNQGVREQELAELEHYLKNRNGFLANFGKQTQKRFNLLLDREYAIQECAVDSSLNEKPLSLLEVIKKDIVEWRWQERVVIKEGDVSIQLHEVSSKKREVEVLFTHLMDLTHKHEIQPSDILVLAPDISEYFPFIYQVFHEETPFPIEVHDLEMISQYPLLQGFWELLCLKEKRWEQKDIFKLLMIQPLLDRYGWKQEEVAQLKTWCESAQIRWGFNQKHREEMISLTAPLDQALELSAEGTWEYGFERLLFGLVNVQEESVITKDTAQYYPMEKVEMIHAELLGEFINLVQNLYAEIVFFSKAKLSIVKWIEYFRLMIDRYFLIEVNNALGKQSLDFLIEQLKTLVQLSHKVGETTYPFSSLKRFFQKAFCKKSALFTKANKEAICFASLQSGQIYPAKVIWLLGMEEGAFPRTFKLSPLRELEEQKMDYTPSIIEQDRQMLLDVVLYAQEFIRISYSSMDVKDGKRKNVSFLIEEFFDFIKQYYPDANKIKHAHKSISFHKEELLNNHLISNFSHRTYLLAQSFYHKKGREKFFIPELYPITRVQPFGLEKITVQERVSLKELKTFARNPIQHYFNRVLGLYIRREEVDGDLEKGDFILPSLEKARFKIESVNTEFDTAYERLNLLGRLPSGVFKEIAKDQLQEERTEFLNSFFKLGIDPLKMMTIELNSSCKEPVERKNGYWLVPHLEIELEGGGKVQIEGILENVSYEGLVVYGKNCLQDYVKIWPIYLVFHQIVSYYFSDQIKRQLLLTKDSKVQCSIDQDVNALLKSYLSYFLRAKTIPSPFFPAWAEALLSNSREEIAKVIKSSFGSSKRSYGQFLDEYQKCVFQQLEPFCAETVQDVWGKDFRFVFEPLMIWRKKEGHYA